MRTERGAPDRLAAYASITSANAYDDASRPSVAGDDPVNNSDPTGLCSRLRNGTFTNGNNGPDFLVAGPCPSTPSQALAAESQIQARYAGGGFSWTSGLKAVADYGAGIANTVVSGVTLGHVHISAPYCGYSWSYDVGGIYANISVGVFGVEEVEVPAALEEAAGSGAEEVSGAQAVMDLPTEETWGNPSTLARHFRDHGAEFGATSPEDYANQASEFFQRSQLEGLPTKIGSDGVIRVYDSETNTFGAYNPNGTTKTFFTPKRGIDYWNDQLGDSPWTGQ